MIRLIINISA